MEPTARLYQCTLCHKQMTICSKCDHGQIYCDDGCSSIARKKSLKAAGKRYQETDNGKRKHAARQARYEMRLKINLTHHTSPLTLQSAPIQKLENNADKAKTGHQNTTLCCCFCGKPVSFWLRNDFLRRRGYKKSIPFAECPQAP